MRVQQEGYAYEVHFGDPFWRGGPPEDLIRFIQSICRTDSEGKRYYAHPKRGLTRLRAPQDFEILNKLIDERRKGGF